MSYIDPMDLGPTAFRVTHRARNTQWPWKMLHAHQGIELLYVYEGEGEVTVEGRSFPMRPGMLLCFQPYQLHKIDVPGTSGGQYVRSILTFDPRVAEPLLSPFPRLHAWFLHFWKGTLPEQVFDLGSDMRLSDILDDYHLAMQSPGADTKEEQALLLTVLLRYLQIHVVPGGRMSELSAKTTVHVEKMMDWVEANYKQPLQLERMAAELHLSSYYISHLFRKYTGISLSAYIAERRLREACDQLLTTTRSIREIAEDVGSFSSSHFCQLFKKRKGISPQVYRKMRGQAFDLM
ncbi:AraC-type DNA-binding protein [Paenibacillus sp. UNCCL117]|uniref:AraC family transcriptional regulator n=1 Tax=unclassified Paenibacillus TaxID=185978 RepID=UPI00088E6CF4|nr:MULTISPECIES: AraC family transcriptional regulator [unclassified Paenibacillus]SDE18565.1 AraC-type DNA-binding protein [Paenibacillus sp. cl123]SFW62189.1 AraC-type DNA-binding protein [Paenibacillus sp. UNCCL117]